jgi:hypothetical protein
MRRIHRNPTAALVVAIVALVAALQGPALAQDAYSAASKAINGSKIKKKSIAGNKIKNNSITGTQVKESTLGTVKNATNAANATNAVNATNATTAAKAATADKATTADTAGPSGEVGWITRYSKTIDATSGADFTAARTAAPEVELGKIGTLTIYAKCFSYAGTTEGYVYIKTSQDRAIVDSDYDDRSGGPNAADWLNTDTVEVERELFNSNVSSGSNIYGSHTTEWSALSPDGKTGRGEQFVAVKNGPLAAGNGAYGGDGDKCVIAGQIERFNS